MFAKFFSPRLDPRSREPMLRYSLAFCIFIISLGETIRHYGLAWFLDDEWSFIGSLGLVFLVIAVSFSKALKFSSQYGVLIAFGAVVVLLGNYIQQSHTNSYWLFPFLAGWLLVLRFMSEGPKPDGWGDLRVVWE